MENLYSRVRNITEKQVGDDIFLVNSKQEVIYNLNVTGAAVWRLLVEPRSVVELIGIFQDAFKDAPSIEEIEEDIMDIIEDLLDEELVVCRRQQGRAGKN